MDKKTGLVVFTGVTGETKPEARLNRGLIANTIDILEKTKSISDIDKQVLVTNSNELQELEASRFPKLAVEKSSEDFHFGESLYEVINGFGFDAVLYVGGGSAPLLKEADFRKLAGFLVSHPESSISNNFYSSDMIGFRPAERLLDLEIPKRDNELGWLTRDGGLTPYELERSARTQLDMDSPIDLLPLKLSDDIEGELAEYVSSLDWGNPRIKELTEQFTDQDSRLVLFGRVGAKTFSYLEENAACHVDVFSEGRGSYSGEVEGLKPSIGGSLLERGGPEELIELLTDQGTGLFLDTRVLFDYMGKWPSPEDRFSSDLMEPTKIDTPYLKRLTRVALESDTPVVLGGHSILSGSLYLLTDLSWKLSEPKSVNVRPKIFEL